MRILLWHGWLLEGSGSNVYTARVAEILRADGHEVVLVCQERHPERYPWIDAAGVADADGVDVRQRGVAAADGRCTLVRPEIGTLLPVFVVDEYEGFEVRRFVDLTDDELEDYLDRNARALSTIAAWFRPNVVVAGHAIPGGEIARRALGPGRYAVKIHGSDLEYAIRLQDRYADLARSGLEAASGVAGASEDVLRRCVDVVPSIAGRIHVVAPGVDTDRFRRRPRREALLAAADALDADADTPRGRPDSLDERVADAVRRRTLDALDALADTYDHAVPDPSAAARLRALADVDGPIVGAFGKLIPQKGVELLLAAAHRSRHRPTVLVVGFGSYRERLQALVHALRTGDEDAAAWLRDTGMPIGARPFGDAVDVVFTGRLDHRYAPEAIAALDVLVVPSILDEAFGMVAAEGAAAGALPLVARHSGLAEVASALEGAVGRPGLFSFEPGTDAVDRVVDGLDRLLDLEAAERQALAATASAYVAATWSWRATANALVELARP